MTHRPARKAADFGDVSTQNSSRGARKATRSEFDSFGAESLFRFRTTKTDCGHGNRLIVLANAKSRIEPVGLGPAFDEPQRVSAAGGESLDGSGGDHGMCRFIGRRDASSHFSQNSIDKRSGGTLASALDEFDALIDGSTRGNAAEPAQLINSEAERSEDLGI